MSATNSRSSKASELHQAIIASYKSEILQLQKQVSSLSTTQRFLNDENSSLASNVASLKSALSAAEHSKQSSTTKLNWLIDKLKQENSTLQFDSQTLKNQLSLADQKLSVLQDEKSQLIEQSERNFNKLTGRIRELEAEKLNNSVASSSTRAENKATPFDEKLSNCYKLFEDNEDLLKLKTDSKLINLLNEETHRLSDKIKFFQGTVNSQTSQLYDLNCQISDMKSEKDVFFTLLDTIAIDDTSSNDDKSPFYFENLTNGENSKLTNFVELYNSQAIHLSQLMSSNQLLKDTIDSYIKINESLRLDNKKDSAAPQNDNNHIERLNSEKELLLAKIKILNDRLSNYSDFMMKAFAATPGMKKEDYIEGNLGQKDANHGVQLSTFEQVEKSLDKYIQLIENNAGNRSAENLKKRKFEEHTTDGNASVNDQICEISQLQSRIVEQESKISDLAAEIQHYKCTISKVTHQLSTRYNEEFNESSTHKQKEKILKLNCQLDPFYNLQQIKKSQLEALKKENKALLSKIGTSNEISEQDCCVPKEVLQRYVVEMDAVQTQLDSAKKAKERLREVYGRRTRDLLNSLNVLFGFIVEPSLSNSGSVGNDAGKHRTISDDGNMKFKLTRSIHRSPNNHGEKGGSEVINFIIVVDLAKLDVSYKANCANKKEGDEFLAKHLNVEELVKLYVIERKDIAGFLASLNLGISQYENGD